MNGAIRAAFGAVALGLALLLAGCDDGTVISHVDKKPQAKIGDLVTMQENAGLLVEIHGVPWKGITDEELAELIKPPAGAAQDVRFRSVPPGQWVNGRGHRLVLHFDSTTAPNSQQDCQATAELRTKPPTEEGFTVNATFCTKEDWVAHGYLEATKFKAGDRAEFTRLMQNLITAIYQDDKGK